MQKNSNTRQDERTGFRYAFPGILNKVRDNPLLAPRTETFDSLITSIYTKSRQAEHLIPMFRIPIRLAGAGDFLSPFLPKDYLKWQATGSEIYGSGQTPLEKYKDLIEQAKQGKTTIQQNEMEIGLRNAGMKFQKTGRVFGDIVTKHAGQDITVMSGVYLAETGTFADSSLINLWRSGSRQVNVFPSLSPNTLNKFNDAVKKFAGSGFSDESLSELGKYGGFIRGLASTAITKYVAAMNRFLREPMPFVDSLLAKTTEKELALDPIGKRVLEHFERSGQTATDLFKQGDKITVQERVPFGKLPPWMRPYVSDAKWTKSSGRMFAGLVGKGLLWATALPAAYSALDFSRRKMDTLPERAVGAPLFAMVGMAAGSLIETAPLRKMPRLTKSQAIGAGIGFAIGALPMFDKGITAGGANLLSRIHLGASKLMDKIDAHTIVERQEDLMPGITSPFTAAGFAFTGGIISIVNNEIGTIGGRIDRHKLRKLIESGIPLSDPRVQALLQRESIGAIATTVELEKILAGEKVTPTTRAGFIAQSQPLHSLDMSTPFHTDSKTSRYEMAQEIYNRTQDDIKRQAELTHQVRVKDRGVAFRIKEGVKSVWHGPRGFVRGALKGAALFAGIAEVGAIASGVLGGNLNPAGLVPGFLLKMFGAGTRPDELEDIYSGKKEVAVRKGRFWLMGRSKFEGEGIERFRPHRLFLAQTDAEDNALYGSVDEKMAYEPIFSPIKAIFDDEFKYHRERRMMYESPTPLSGAMFTDVPIVGDVLASTLGELIKPTVKIRPAEWYVGGGYATQERGFFTETFGGREPPQPGMGSPMMATPADSNSFITTSSRFIKRISEQAGLFGFMTTTAAGMKRSYEPVMERADMMYGLRKKFWSMDLGDPGLCFVKGTQVLMADRTYKNIENVKIGDEVFSADSRKRPRKVVDIVKRSGRRKRLLTIKPYGCDSFTCTYNHWIPAVRREDRSQYKDVQAQDLNENCYLLSPIVLSINTRYHYQIFRQTMAPLPNCVDPDSIVPNILVGEFNEFSLHRIESIKEENYEAEELYDLTIEDLHYYVVGQTIVHNTEAVRRFLPPDKTAYYNSLTNTAPSWLPTNNWYQDFGRGNYWGKIAEAPIRLPGRGLCVHPETPIATLGGESIKAQDVEVGDMVLTHKGPRMVLRTFRRAHKGTMYKVHTTGTSMTTILTKNHYVKTFHYNKSNHLVYDWIPAYRLSVEDIVCCPTEEALEYRVITDIEKLYFEGSVYDFEIEDVHEYTATFLIHNSTLHPELEGVNPEQYSASWKYKILSDLAYGSQEWKLSKQMVIAQLQGGMLTDEEKSMISETNRQLEAKRTKRKFEEYRFARDALQKEKVTVTGVLEDGSFTVAEYGNRVFSLGGINMTMAGISREAIRTGNAKTQAEAMRYSKSKKTMMMDTVREHLYNGAELDIYIHGDEITNFESSTSLAYIPELSKKIVSLGAEVEDNAFSRQVKFNGVQRFFGAAWEMVRHNADAPLSPGKAFAQFLPFQTEHKYIVRSSAIEDYARFQVYGPKIQMWEEIVEDFMGTAMNEWRAKIAGDFLPKKVQFRRTFQEYFDRLTWMKYFMLEQGARKEKNEELAEVFAERKRQTISGADPFRGFKDIWRALPRSERDYYRSFIDAENDEDRERILALVPEPVGKIYQAQWLEKEVRAITNKQEAGIASQSDKQRLKRLYELRRVEGQDWSREKEQEYRQEGDPNVSYADWARLQEMKEYFSNFKLPDKNWVAWQPGVSVQDVELKLAQQEGINIHDLDLWESQAQEIEYKPYIKGAVKEVSDWADPGISPQKVNAHIRDMMGMMGRYSRVTTMPGSMEGRKVVMMARDNRFEDVRQVMDGRTEI